MTERIFNFSAGPAVLPVPVLEEAQRDLLSLPGVGMSVMEISHRSKTFDEIIAGAESGLRELLNIPSNYHILFLQGGASLQFSMAPMNFLPAGDASSNILSRVIDVNKYALIYAGAQKNMGPSGLTVVILRDDLLSRIPDGLATILDYRTHVENKSLYNTPNTWGIYILRLVCNWLKHKGGVA